VLVPLKVKRSTAVWLMEFAANRDTEPDGCPVPLLGETEIVTLTDEPWVMLVTGLSASVVVVGVKVTEFH